MTWLTGLACEAAQTKTELSDIVNVLIEELVRCRYELPPLATLQRTATQACNKINNPFRALRRRRDVRRSHESGKHVLTLNLQVAEKATAILTIFVSLTTGLNW